MTILLILLGVEVYAACALITYKGVFAYMQKEFPMIARENRTWDRCGALIFALLAPISPPLWAYLTGFFKHGFSAGTEADVEQRYQATCAAIKAEVRARYRQED